jgi:uncharacterized protein YecE (DUF72 family)
MSATVLLGTQGWNYPAWVGPLYPPGTRPGEMLGLYARAFRTVEVDSTFYAIPPEPVVAGWRDRVPGEFRFALKVPQEVTHDRRLVDTESVLERFVIRARVLGEKLGPLLLQLPPDFTPTADARRALTGFIAALPPGFRWAVEFRHSGWLTPETSQLLRSRNVALTLVDGRWIKRGRMLDLAIEPTADFGYVRWMGPDRQLTDYSKPQVDRSRELSMWAVALAALAARVKTMFGYFNNHFQGHSPHSVREFQRMIGQKTIDPEKLRSQVEIF